MGLWRSGGRSRPGGQGGDPAGLIVVAEEGRNPGDVRRFPGSPDAALGQHLVEEDGMR